MLFKNANIFYAEGAMLELTAHENIGILKKHIIPDVYKRQR